jgi:hypothetical protein
MLRNYILLNIILLFFYHPGVVFGTIMQMSQATSNQEIIDNLYWIIPQTMLFASIPNFFLAVFFLIKKNRRNLLRNFLLAEAFVFLIHFIINALILFL